MNPYDLEMDSRSFWDDVAHKQLFPLKHLETADDTDTDDMGQETDE